MSQRSQFALSERLELLKSAANLQDVVVTDRGQSAISRCPRRGLTYILDVNSVTVPAMIALRARGAPYVVDTGDDPGALARTNGGYAWQPQFHRLAERVSVGGAVGVVCRGSVHVPILAAKTRAPVQLAPDTVADDLLDSEGMVGSEDIIATFGSVFTPPSGDRAYGWEVIDILARMQGARGIIVGRGPGVESLRQRAARMGVTGRLLIEGPVKPDVLPHKIGAAGFITSVQSNDLAGWVRTTGKLPIALGLGKVLVSTRVGEAALILPKELLVKPGSDQHVVESMCEVIERGTPAGWGERGRLLAEPFRRSRVANELAAFLEGL